MDNQIAYFGYLDWLIFFFIVLFMIILMLNLLISIITEAQGNYTETWKQQTYREKALQIRQKGRSFFWPICKRR